MRPQTQSRVRAHGGRVRDHNSPSAKYVEIELAAIEINVRGHLAVQYASPHGVRGGRDRPRRRQGRAGEETGPHHYIDGSASDVAKALQALGGAAVVAT